MADEKPKYPPPSLKDIAQVYEPIEMTDAEAEEYEKIMASGKGKPTCEVKRCPELPTPIQWHSREVAMTWPEGSFVICKFPHLSTGYWYRAYDLRIALLNGPEIEFALLELPKEDVT